MVRFEVQRLGDKGSWFVRGGNQPSAEFSSLTQARKAIQAAAGLSALPPAVTEGGCLVYTVSMANT